ncbi:MAG TPA: phosphopantetheine-binding protein [Chitinophaga sp.]|uniref:Acyl carrier protein n=1 Tax=Chitinophaga tropicalis TaxID=2683588 RepID=A0A7K1U611_9BACT|nr:phosphopantetheine-binding protein [Chitinophaga tropicalis]MVT09801.1 acyl carrier protein [Chitinophaga tropicalis]HJT73214.1 phosphopantetheine-binding protein [Chitinophaga sp.]
METLIETLKLQIIDELNLDHLDPAGIDPDAPLFNEGMGLDSIDALALVMLLEKYYGIKAPKGESMKPAFASLRTLATYIQEHQAVPAEG